MPSSKESIHKKDLILKISAMQKIPVDIAKIFVSSLSSLKGSGLTRRIEAKIYGAQK